MRESGTKIDVLTNNAGVMALLEMGEAVDGGEVQIGVKDFWHHPLTRLLRPLIVDGYRVVFVPSEVHVGVPDVYKSSLKRDNINFEDAGS